MTIGTDRYQILHRINRIFFTNTGYINDVVNMDKILPYITIGFLEIKIAYLTIRSVVFNTLLSCYRVTFVIVDQDLFHLPLGIVHFFVNFIGVNKPAIDTINKL